MHVIRPTSELLVGCGLSGTYLKTFTELQIIFESNAYLSPNFLLNADFQNLKLFFYPLYFFAMRKREGITVLERISVVLCRFKHRQWFAIAYILCCKNLLIITQRKPLTIRQQMDRQMDIVNSVYFRFNFANQYALLWTPNAYFYALFIFPMRFYQFSMHNYAFTCLICSSAFSRVQRRKYDTAVNILMWQSYNGHFRVLWFEETHDWPVSIKIIPNHIMW